jgi:hypothetical protein
MVLGLPGLGYIGVGRAGLRRRCARPVSIGYNPGRLRGERLIARGNNSMPRARFRIRTIMIVIAAFAVLLVLLKSLTQPVFDGMAALAATGIFLVAATVVLLVAVMFFLAVIFILVSAIVDVSAFTADLWRIQTRRRQFTRNSDSQIGTPEPGPPGEVERV